MQLPTQVQCRLSHFKRQLLALAAAQTFRIVFLCQLFAVSRNTFYKYRRLERVGKLDYFGCAPLHHGLAKTQAVIDAVLDAQGQAQVPEFRFTWKPSAARPLPVGLDVQAIFQMSPPLRTANTRQVDAALTIQYLKQRYVFPQLNKGDRVHVAEHKDRIEFFYQGHLLQTVIKPPRRQAAAIRQVKADGCVLFQRQRIPVDCPPQTPVVIVREGDELIFSVNDQVILRLRGQETVQQRI